MSIESTYEGRLSEVQRLFRNARTAGREHVLTGAPTDTAVAAEMRANRQASMRKEGATSLSLASARPKDPMWYWKQSNLPFDIWSDPLGIEIQRVRDFCRLLYVTHPLLGSAVDIYSKYPLAGMDIVCPKDPSIAEFHREMFFDELDYEEFLVDVGREYWLVGEGFPLAGFNELTGTFDSDDLMLPQDVNVIHTPFSNEPRFEMALPWEIREILHNRRPELEYRQLVENYPEFLAMNVSDWTSFSSRDSRFMIPVSSNLMHHVRRKGDSFYRRGIPILMRAFRAVAQEEMLNAAQDSISQRLYTPLILARLGASATDLGTNTPWLPQQGDLDDFVEDVNAALAADFRMIVTHFAVNMQNVFGRESMPDLSREFERLEQKMLQAFGMSKTMISGADGGQTYAADALNRDLVTQLLVEYQRRIKRLFRRRAEVVAEAQGHYDFQRKGSRVVPIMETVQEVDEETGDVRFVERPKLLLPELRIKAMNVRDEEQYNSLVESLRASGVPISQKTRLVNVPIDLDEEIESVIDEQVEQAVVAQEVRRRTYTSLKARGLPIPQDLRDDFEPRIATPSGDGGEGAHTMDDGPSAEPIPTVGIIDPATTVPLAPTEDQISGEDAGPIEELAPQNRVLYPTRPPESDEQRKDMPKAALSRTAVWVDGDSWGETHLGDYETALARNDLDVGDEAIDTDPFRELPVLGSYRTRHMAIQRDLRYFYRRHELADVEP